MTLRTFQLLALTAATLIACGDKDDDSGAADGTDGTTDGADGGTDGTDGADGASDGADGTADGADGTADGTDGTTTEEIYLAGEWVDNYGSDHVITNEAWTSYGGGSIVHLSQYDNAGGWAVGQNDATASYNPEKWSRFDWHEDGDGVIWFCTAAFDAETEADALAAPASDPSSPSTSGCGGTFPWSSLEKAE